jgi:hypothetical protein
VSRGRGTACRKVGTRDNGLTPSHEQAIALLTSILKYHTQAYTQALTLNTSGTLFKTGSRICGHVLGEDVVEHSGVTRAGMHIIRGMER